MNKWISVLVLAFAMSPVAQAAYPEMDDSIDTEAVIEFSAGDTVQDHNCPPPTTEWTCFARDARGGSLGVSTSFTKRHLAAGRALASCQRKSDIPNTCHITRCRQPVIDCDHGHGHN